MIRVTDAYRRRLKHSDAHTIGESLQNYSRFPTTFDGKLPSESLGSDEERVKVGETYFFAQVGDEGTLGTVTSVMVDEAKKEMFIGLHNGVIIRGPISDVALSEYKEFGEAYFGQVPTTKIKQPKNEFEWFNWFMDAYKDAPRANMLQWLSPNRDRQELENLNDDDLRMIYCEAHVAGLKNISKPSPPDVMN